MINEIKVSLKHSSCSRQDRTIRTQSDEVLVLKAQYLNNHQPAIVQISCPRDSNNIMIIIPYCFDSIVHGVPELVKRCSLNLSIPVDGVGRPKYKFHVNFRF